MRYSLLLVVFLFGLNTVQSQELICDVRVLSNKIQSSDKQKFTTLQTALREFVNNRKWTNDAFKDDERIECSFSITLEQELSTDKYSATLSVQASRPIFNSSYYSPLLNYVDKEVQFRYIEFQTLEFNENTHISNLTSLISFYCYIIIGLDYITFSPDGGMEYIQKAKNVVNNAQSAPESGWKAFETNKNRYWLAEEILDSKYKDFSEVLYSYHRLGLDNMYDDSEKSRGVITESLEQLKKVKRLNPSAFILQLFFDAKANEITNIYSNAFQDEKARILNLLVELDPSNISKYNKIKEESKESDGSNSRF
jgi:hypothetical protein